MRLEIKDAAKTFGTTQALAPVRLDIADGEFIAIVGPSGCGKSTLLRMVAGLMDLSAGQILLNGAPIKGPVTELGIVFQQPVLLDWRTIVQNVLFQVEMRGLDREKYRARAMELLDQVGLKEFADSSPYQLSGGMKQRAGIARALVHDPRLLLMDEPFGALDALTREQIRVDLEELWLQRRMTVIFVTHSIDEAVLLADRVIEVDIPRPRALAGRRHPEFLRI